MNGRKRLGYAVFEVSIENTDRSPVYAGRVSKRLIPPWEKILFYMETYETPGTVCFKTAESRIFPPANIQKGRNKMAVKEKVRIKLKGYEHATVDAAAAKIVETAKRTGSRVAGPIPLPTNKEVITILRAVHKYKDSREQFELRTHKRLIDVIRPTNKTVEALQNLELPAGVEMTMEA